MITAYLTIATVTKLSRLKFSEFLINSDSQGYYMITAYLTIATVTKMSRLKFSEFLINSDSQGYYMIIAVTKFCNLKIIFPKCNLIYEKKIVLT